MVQVTDIMCLSFCVDWLKKEKYPVRKYTVSDNNNVAVHIFISVTVGGITADGYTRQVNLRLEEQASSKRYICVYSYDFTCTTCTLI